MPGDGFGTAEQQNAVAHQRVVEGGDHERLRVGIEVDEQIAAGDQVDPGEWRIAHQAMGREGA